jgi:hypothetical protein
LSLFTGVACWTLSITRFFVRGNRAGFSFGVGRNVVVGGGLGRSVCESNMQFAIVAFKRALLDAFRIENVWFEHDGYLPPRAGEANPLTGAVHAASYEIAGIEALLTAPSQYLAGEVSGPYDPSKDGNFAFWIGSAAERSLSTYPLGPPSDWQWVNCRIGPKHGVLRVRSMVRSEWDRCHIQSETGAETFRNAAAGCYKLHIRQPRSEGRDRLIWGMQVPGATYSFDEAPIAGVHASAAPSAWKDICDLSVMSPGNRYRYSVWPHTADTAAWNAYAETGYADLPAAGIYPQPIVSYSGTSSEMRVGDAGKLQYRQTGAAALSEVRFSVWCEGPIGGA